MQDVSFEYGVAELKSIRDIAQDRSRLSINGQNFRTSDRFWRSLSAHFKISSSVFSWFSPQEVFGRIVERSGESTVRYCVERTSPNSPGRLLALSSPAKAILKYDDALGLLEGEQASELYYDHDGSISSSHIPRSGYDCFRIAGDAFVHRFRLRIPIDGFGRPAIYLALLRQVCSNGIVGYTPAFRSELACADLASIRRALDGFDSDEGYSALRQRMEMSQRSWASVYEANRLYRTLTTALNAGSVTDSRILPKFHALTGDVALLYGLANADALSSKQQRALPVKCRVYDLLNFSSEVSTHHATAQGAVKLQGWLGTLVSRPFDLEGTADQIADFSDFFVGVGQG